jgi:predicted lipoprotein with Yx(FWY)xxD motif
MRPKLLLLALSVALVATAAAISTAGAPDDAAAAAEAKRPTLTARSSPYGRMLFDGRGFALYAFTADRRGGPSRCRGACARAWPPYIVTGKLKAGAGVQRGKLGTIRRADGRRQVTYNGRPLYYYVDDRRAGQVLCQNVYEFGGLWLVVRPGGALVR